MPRIFLFEVSQMRTILQALRAMEDKEKRDDPSGSTPHPAALAVQNFCAQIYGPTANLSPFMRAQNWLKEEIKHELKEGEPHNCKCECGRLCKGKMCVICWRTVYKELYEEPEPA